MNQRIEFALRSLRTDNFRALCQEYGISTKTGYKWQQRFLKSGENGMAEESRRPHRSPRGLEEGVVCEMVRLKHAHPTWGPRKLRWLYGRLRVPVPSESSFKRVLARAGLTEPRRVRSRQSSGRLHSGRRGQTPNEVWTVDFKGWWHGGSGRRCEPLTVRDEFSRYVLELRLLADAKTRSVQACFERLFERHGLPEAIRSDNGVPFASVQGLLGLTRLSAWWVALGIDLERGRPGHPQDNGGHERLHLDVSRELEKQRVEAQAVLDEWRRCFNDERPHEALGMRCPAEVYERSPRAYEQSPEDLVYEGMEHRKVHHMGHICWGGQTVFISVALRGWSVGLEPAAGGLWRVWFGRLLLGELDGQRLSFKPIAPASAPHRKEPANR